MWAAVSVSRFSCIPNNYVSAWAAQKLGGWCAAARQIRGVSVDLMGRDNLWLGEAVVEENGPISALRMTSMANLGSWLSNFSIFVPTSAAARSITGVYDLPVASFRALGVITNTPATDAYRGAGRPEANYAIERMIDIVAAELGLDRLAVRKENLIQPEQIPYKMAQGARLIQAICRPCWMPRWTRQTGKALRRAANRL